MLTGPNVFVVAVVVTAVDVGLKSPGFVPIGDKLAHIGFKSGYPDAHKINKLELTVWFVCLS